MEINPIAGAVFSAFMLITGIVAIFLARRDARRHKEGENRR
ncbi:MAG TPA: hypothetical protein VFE30_14760 [Anaeromyxobacteraceae bacterium]|jgi:prolipoprotein diacylglyceryltransferase|nr:hypothetical protein [Anaeromyxobacteraceae bacterium]